MPALLARLTVIARKNHSLSAGHPGCDRVVNDGGTGLVTPREPLPAFDFYQFPVLSRSDATGAADCGQLARQ